MNQRVAIVGTAQSWTQTPWSDTSLYVMSLNDAYRLPGFVRADCWMDFHPLNRFYFPVEGRPVHQHQIPQGYYCRPSDHLEWLAHQSIPLYLHPDCETQLHDPLSPEKEAARAAVLANPMHRPFPKAAIEAHFGRYFTSSPAWMMALAILQGAKEIHVYGIHLATEFEYVKQRPNFEFLMGCLLGKGKRTVTVKDECRYYESQDGLLVLPESSPVLQENFQYAFDPKPDTHLEPLKWELHKLGIKKNRNLQALVGAEWWQPLVPVQRIDKDGVESRDYVRRKTLREEMTYLDAMTMDYQEQIAWMQSIGV